jgi:hypothetical protein
MPQLNEPIDAEFEKLQAEALLSKARVESAPFVTLDEEQFQALVQDQVQFAGMLQAPLITLTPRHPYDDATLARIDSYHPGRWDTESDLVFMSPIVQVGASPGEWDGTVIYVSIPSLASGTYLVSAVFSGYDTTMYLRGPWGETTAYNAQTSTNSTVLATAVVDQGLFFTLSCKGGGLGYLSTIQVFSA